MTIKEAIEIIKAYRDKLMNSPSNQLDGDIKAFEIAIRSLEALPEIRKEIASYKDDKLIHAERNEMIDIVLEIIDKYLKEIGE